MEIIVTERIARLLGPLVDRMVRRNVTADYRRLKELLENAS